MQRVLRLFVTDNRYASISQRQIEAFTDLMALAMIIDRHIAEPERDAIAELLTRFDWPEQRPSEHFINRSVQRAWDMLETETLDADALTFCKRIHEELAHDWLREEAFVSVTHVVHADEELDPAESALLEHLQEAFGYDRERVDALTARASRDDFGKP